MRIMRTVVAAVFLSIPLLMIMQQAEAAKPGGKGKQAPMFISGVNFLELGAKTRLEISGVSFDNGAFPVVSLDGAGELMVVSATATLIEADILPKVPDGDYTLRVSIGSLSKQNAALDLHFGGSMSIVCLDWYLTTGNGQHVHVEAFVQDEAGNPVIGAIVTMENTRDDGAGSAPVVYQTKSSTTFKYAGYNHGESCPIEVAKASGATGQYCCVGNEDFCPAGRYEALVLSVEAPVGSDRKWDGVTPPNSIDFLGMQ